MRMDVLHSGDGVINTTDIAPKRTEYNAKCSIGPLLDKLSNFNTSLHDFASEIL